MHYPMRVYVVKTAQRCAHMVNHSAGFPIGLSCLLSFLLDYLLLHALSFYVPS